MSVMDLSDSLIMNVFHHRFTLKSFLVASAVIVIVLYLCWLQYVIQYVRPFDRSNWPEYAEQRWTQERAERWYQAQPLLVGCNYIPRTASNTLEMWQKDTFDSKTIDQELGWAAAIGMNVIRVFLHPLLYEADDEYYMDRIDEFLNISYKHQIRVIFVFFDDVWNPKMQLGVQKEPRARRHNSQWVQSPGRKSLEAIETQEEQTRLENYVKPIMENFKHDQRVLMWDLYNEPANPNHFSYVTSDSWQKSTRSLRLLQLVFTWARDVNPDQPITTAVWTWGLNTVYDVGVRLLGIRTLEEFSLQSSDVVTFHSYEALPEFKKIVERLQSAEPRPLICTEYMARTQNSTVITHLPFAKEHKVGMLNWGLVDGRSQTIYPWNSWGKEYTAEPDPWFHDLLRANGQPYDKQEIDMIKNIVGKYDNTKKTASSM